METVLRYSKKGINLEIGSCYPELEKFLAKLKPNKIAEVLIYLYEHNHLSGCSVINILNRYGKS